VGWRRACVRGRKRSVCMSGGKRAGGRGWGMRVCDVCEVGRGQPYGATEGVFA